jgi:vancomycin permeability regulator SanA
MTKRVKLKMAFVVLVALAALWFVAHAAWAVWLGVHDDVRPADAALVFGSKVQRNGVPSPRLRERLERALALHRQGLVHKVIVSGGLGREGFDEAVVMAQYLEARGVPAEDVIVDSDGYDTYRTVQNARRIMQEQDLHSLIAVSQYFHLARVRLAFARAGVSEVYYAHARVQIDGYDLYSVPREFVAYYYYLLRPF